MHPPNETKVVDKVRASQKAAPYVFALSILLIFIPTYFYKLNVTVLVLGPAIGICSFTAIVWYWKTNKLWFNLLAIIPWITAGQAAGKESLTWALPQTIGFGLFFWSVPLWVVGFALVAHFDESS